MSRDFARLIEERRARHEFVHGEVLRCSWCGAAHYSAAALEAHELEHLNEERAKHGIQPKEEGDYDN